MFTDKDIAQINEHGLSESKVKQQIKNFVQGFPPAELQRPATEGDGISKLTDQEINNFTEIYDKASTSKEIVKFVPASGAATRMFKNLFAFHAAYDGSDEAYDKMIQNQGKGSAFEFFKHLEDFAFYEDLREEFKKSGIALEEAHLKRQYKEILDYFLLDKGLNYGSLPKGLLKFHKYGRQNRTPVEEHIVEGAQYAVGDGRKVKIHFTVSPEHQAKFEEHVAAVVATYEKEHNVSVDISYSVQNPATDTIAVDLQNNPFRNDDGSLLFRPAGHGALLENLDRIDADIVFIKNIDNVVPDRLKQETVTYKKVLAGILLDKQNRIFDFLEKMQNTVSPSVLEEARSFVREELGYESEKELDQDELFHILNRPVRVCGMVKSEGDPGGGPFWIKEEQGNVSLQIVETAQIDLSKTEQKEVFGKATHFNPVDLVCGLRNYKGEAFDLMACRDDSTGFVTQKSKDGKDLKAQELPGLWNGSMAYWNTIFVEVPVITFNPVKTVNDLLFDEHQ
jgi:hypothetical protein